MSDDSPTSQHGHLATESLRATLAALWRYKMVVPAVALTVTAGVAFWVMREPKVYEATATLEYDPNPARPLGTAVEDNATSEVSFWDTQEFYETQNYLLKSRSLAERVARALDLQHDKSFFGIIEENQPSLRTEPTLEDATDQLLAATHVEQIRDTRIVRVSVRDRNPERAQLIANAIVDAYIEKSLEDRLGASGRAMEWLADQMQNLKRELDSSELALYKFREQHHSLSASLEERQKIIAAQLEQYTETLTGIHAKRLQTAAQLSVLKELLTSEQDLHSFQVGPVGDDPVVHDLRQKYRESSEALERLAITYGEAHPEVRAAQASRDAARAQLHKHIDAIVHGVHAELLELERAEEGIQKAINEVNQQGLALSLQEIEYSKLDRERDNKAHLFGLVMQRAAETDLTRALRLANARPVDRATLPRVPVSPRVNLIIAVGAFLGLMLGVGAAITLARLDNKVRNPSDLEARGLAVLGVLPTTLGSSNAPGRRVRRRVTEQSNPDLVVHQHPQSPAAECCRTIRTNLTFQAADRPLRLVAVTSAMPRDGKTTASISIAIVLAQSGKRVLLVDTDLRKPRIHKAFSIAPGLGVTTILAGEATLQQAVHETKIPNLTVLPCGPLPPNPAELLHTQRFAQILKEVRDTYDVTILDSPPLGAVTDPAIIAPQVDGTILVARARTTRRADVDAALAQLRNVSARVVGAVVNGVNLHDSGYGSYYAYYRGYYAEEAPPSAIAQESAKS